MTSLLIRQRWTPYWIAIPLLGVYAGFGWVLFRDFGQPDQGVRIIVPAFLVLGALVLPAALNARIITAGPEGVKVTNGPIPRGRKVNVAREDIRSCNVRAQYSTFVSELGRSAKVANYLVGVDTRAGQIDIAYPYLKLEDAQAVARRIAAALNQNTAMPPIAVCGATRNPEPDSRWRRKVFSWGGIFLLAILLGAVWEMS